MAIFYGPNDNYGTADNDLYIGSNNGGNIEWFYSGDGDDILYGYGGVDYLIGDKGNDYINGGAGDDFLWGGFSSEDGDDTIDGGSGDDSIFGQVGNDSLVGGTGNDSLYGGEGNDSIKGGNGDDLLVGGEGWDELTGGSGADIFRLNKTSSFATIKDFKWQEGDIIQIDASVYGISSINDVTYQQFGNPDSGYLAMNGYSYAYIDAPGFVPSLDIQLI